MNRRAILVLAAAIFTIFYSVNLAIAGSLSIASVTIPSSANQGDSFTLSASISGSSASSVSGTLDLPTGISCTPTGSQSVSLDSAGSGTSSWSCSGSAAGDYSNKITVSVSGTDSGTGGSLSDSEQTGLKVLSPASLTASSTQKSGSVIFTIGVNNAGDASTTYTVSTSCGAATCTAPSGTQTVSGSSVNNHEVTVTGAAGSYTGTATITASNGQTLTVTQALTVPASPTTTETTTTTTSVTTTPGVKVTTQKGLATITIPSISAGKSANVNINKTEDVAISLIIISVKNSVNNIQVTVTKLASMPASVTQEISGKVYHYIQIDKNSTAVDTAVNQSVIRFKVEKSWLSSNSVNESTVALYRYESNAWTKLVTTKMGELGGETDVIYYEATSPGLSVFAIAGESATGAVVTPTPAPEPEAGIPPELTELTKGGNILILGGLVLLGVAGFVLYKKGVFSKLFNKGTPWDQVKSKYK
ncbi:MAG: PGF-pre-PGF domain-containing protein [Candidatus Aenigmarchaeota archaeon]|nr:PGF-pre-PGF domain-containing protein [Candidatus Aenigmarchaeota archaeon]